MNFKRKIRKTFDISNVKMKRMDSKEIPDDKEEVRLFVVGIDSDYLIPHFLKHYFDIGVDRIFYIDNDSSDNSLEMLEQYDRVHVWLQKEKFGVSNKQGITWRSYLLDRYGCGNWCLLVDADELFIYPNYENKTIQEFIKDQEDNGCDRVKARLIEMYSNKKVKNTTLKDSLIETCPYFDKSLYGCRDRLFGLKPFFSKMPLLRYHKDILVIAGAHRAKGYNKLSNINCGLLHFKFISNFLLWDSKHSNKLIRKIREKEKVYDGLGDINFYNEEVSMEYVGSKVLDVFKN